MKKVISLLVALTLTISLVPSAFAAQTNSEITINGATIRVLSNHATEIRKNGQVVTIPASIPDNPTGCSNYVSQLTRAIWKIPDKTNVNEFKSPYNMLKYKTSPEDREVTVEHVREFIQSAPLGSSIRVNANGNLGPAPDSDNCWGHSMLLVAKDNKKGTLTILHGGGGVWVETFTYAGFTGFCRNRLKYNYFFRVADLTSIPGNVTVVPSVIAHPKEGLYNLVPACAPTSALDVANKRTDNEANLHIWQIYDNLTSQQWNLERVDGDYYKITNENSGRAVSIQYDSTASGSNVWQYGYGHSNAQKWRFEEAGDGYYYIVPQINTDLCLDVSSASGTDGTNVQVYEKNQTNAQKWKLVPVEKEPETYTLYFDANGGTVSISSKVCTVGEKVGKLPTPTREGYKFRGWVDSTEGFGRLLITDNMGWTTAEDRIAYADWEKIKPTLTTPTPAPETPEPLPPIIIEPEQPPVSEAPIISEPPVTPSPEPEQKAESTLKIYGLTATVTDKGICYNCQVSSNYELTSFSSELRDQGGIGVSFEMGWFGKGTSKDTLEYEYKFSRLWKKGMYMITVEAEDASGKEVSASTTIKLPFDIDGNGKPIKNK